VALIAMKPLATLFAIAFSFMARLLGLAVAMSIISIAAAAAPLSQKPTAETPVTCDVFKDRLVNAEKLIGLVVPAAEFEKDADLNATWYATNYKDHHATLRCKDGLFNDFDLLTNPPLDPDARENNYTTMRAVNLYAAAIYAYTGWSTKRVTAARDDLIKRAAIETRRAKVRGDEEAKASISLPNKATASLSIGIQMYLHIDVYSVTEDEAQAKAGAEDAK
jgi:hypothetical protein